MYIHTYMAYSVSAVLYLRNGGSRFDLGLRIRARLFIVGNLFTNVFFITTGSKY